jgi:hypothetical protein
LPVRIACGSPKVLNVCSKAVNANFSCVVERASQVSRYRLAKSLTAMEQSRRPAFGDRG